MAYRREKKVDEQGEDELGQDDRSTCRLDLEQMVRQLFPASNPPY
jgi:hypothetical protein